MAAKNMNVKLNPKGDYFSGTLDLFGNKIEIAFTHNPEKRTSSTTGEDYTTLGSVTVSLGEYMQPLNLLVYENTSQNTGGKYYGTSRFGSDKEFCIFIRKELSFNDALAGAKEPSYTASFSIKEEAYAELEKKATALDEEDLPF